MRYHVTAHGGLLGKTPKSVHGAEPLAREVIHAARVRSALTVRARRRRRRDNTSMDGEDWPTVLHFLAGLLVTVARCLALPDEPPWIEHEERQSLSRPSTPSETSVAAALPKTLTSHILLCAWSSMRLAPCLVGRLVSRLPTRGRVMNLHLDHFGLSVEPLYKGIAD